MTAPRHDRKSLQVVLQLVPFTRSKPHVLRPGNACGRHFNASEHRRSALGAGRARTGSDGMSRLVVETTRRIRRLGDPINRNVREELVFGELLLDVSVNIAPG